MTTCISVIIPVRNGARTLPLCLDALAAQTRPAHEVIVVDNGSVDETASLARARGATVLHAGGRTPTARNLGAAAATGEALLHIDADMELPPEALAQCDAALRAGAEVVILPERNVAAGFWMRAYSFGKELTRGAPGFEYGRCMPRAWFEAVGGYDEALHSGEDRDLFLRLCAAGARVDRTEAMVRHHVEQMTVADLWRKTAAYTRTRAAFTAKHRAAVADDGGGLLRLLVTRRRLVLATPLRACAWLALTAALTARDRWLLRSLKGR